VKRHELTDEQWIIIKPILPKRTATTGRKPRDQLVQEPVMVGELQD